MRVSIVKETRPDERRVILRPMEVQRFAEANIPVLVEHQAGILAGFSDRDYQDAGATIVSTEEAWESNLVFKFKAPEPHEYRYLRPGMHLGAYLHAEGNPQLARELCRQQVTAYAYEFFSVDGIFPLSLADSEIAGKLAVFYGAYFLQQHCGGSGILLADVAGVRPPRALVVGYGNAGSAAIRLLLALGVDVTVLGTHAERLRRFQRTVPSTVRCALASREVLERELPDVDLVIGAILVSTYDTPALITDNLVRLMKPGSVIIDVTCGYGPGYLPTCAQPTTFDSPVFVKYGVLHCKIDALPAAVPQTTTQAVSSLVAPYLLELAQSVFHSTLRDPVSMAGKIIEHGRVIHDEVKRQLTLSEQYEATYGTQRNK